MEFLLGNVSSTKSSTKPSPSNHADNIAHEVEQYHRSSPVPLNECPLTWWKSECNRFPNLYLLAVKYNCVPACTTPCGKTMEMKAQCTYVEKRKLLSQNTQAVLNHLLFLHHNYTV
jgi:hAT family dimerisation domain.